MHPTFGFLAFCPTDVCQRLIIEHQELERILITNLKCRLIDWNLITVAEDFIGTPYKLHAALSYPPTTLDCSGFSKLIFACAGVWLPRYTVLQVNYGRKINIKNRKPGDLIFFRGKNPWNHPEHPTGIGHVGFVLDKEHYLHTTSQTGGVKKAEIKAHPEILACRRIISRPTNVVVVKLAENLGYLISAKELECVIRGQMNKSSHLQ
jgi:hypothetical protein